MSEIALTKNQQLVMNTLSASKSPLSAYSILDRLRGDGFRAPLQVYRALDKLVNIGLAHRLESLNAFVACSHPACDKHRNTVFMICNECENVMEASDGDLSSNLKDVADRSDFSLSSATIELRGVCGRCA
ncbi:MAG: Fur family transcriptional regulator [Pseudomonadota bacterium]